MRANTCTRRSQTSTATARVRPVIATKSFATRFATSLTAWGRSFERSNTSQTKHPRKEVVTRELGYFRKHKKRMNYAELKAQGFMIGSGVVEAACKTLVTQRLKQSGMRWSVHGAQAILTPRGWDQSERFDKAWALVAVRAALLLYERTHVALLFDALIAVEGAWMV